MAEGVITEKNPEGFLRGALEKIVFFECRVSQLKAELTAERAVAIREKEAAAVARAREIEQETLLTQARRTIASMKSRTLELEERIRLLEVEREHFLSGLVERAQVAGAPADNDEGEAQGEQAVLAGFIAELRSNVERLKLWKAAAEKAGITIDDRAIPELSEPVPQVSTLAARFEKSGRLGVAVYEADRMKELLTTRAERSLYETSMEDLATADPGRRKRAADCLRVLGSNAAAPLVAAALGRENDPSVKTALLSALATIGESSAAALVIQEISDPRPEVRAAALDAAAALAKERSEPELVKSLGDASALVRRRAVLLLGFMSSVSATDALVNMLSDTDPGVARTAALALSGKPSIRAQSALAKALNHQELAVRRCAADAVARWSGETVNPNAPSFERRRAARRIADKLAKLEEGTLRKAVITIPAVTTPVNQPPVLVSEQETIVNSPAPKHQESRAKAETVTVIQNIAEVSVKPDGEPSALETALVGEIRISLRGRTAEELAQLANAEQKAVTASLSMLVRRGTLSQRGSRFFIS